MVGYLFPPKTSLNTAIPIFKHQPCEQRNFSAKVFSSLCRFIYSRQHNHKITGHCYLTPSLDLLTKKIFSLSKNWEPTQNRSIPLAGHHQTGQPDHIDQTARSGRIDSSFWCTPSLCRHSTHRRRPGSVGVCACGTFVERPARTVSGWARAAFPAYLLAPLLSGDGSVISPPQAAEGEG